MNPNTDSAKSHVTRPALLGAAAAVLFLSALLLLPERPGSVGDAPQPAATAAFAPTGEVDQSRIGLDAARLAPDAGASASDTPGASIAAYGR
jgi:hypothetical protein